MTITLQAVNELIQSLESAGELSIKETKVMALAKAFQQLAAENVELKNVFSQKEIPSEAVDAFMETAVMDHDWNETSEWSWVENETEVIHAVLDALKPETPATDRIYAGIKAEGVEQYLALSLKAEREVWRKEGPTDDERIMTIEGIHNCERCGDEGWVVGEMGIIRCACGQAGNSPVIPEGYVMVPKEPTKEMIDAGWLHFMGTKNPSSKGTYKSMLAAAEQEVPDGK